MYFLMLLMYTFFFSSRTFHNFVYFTEELLLKRYHTLTFRVFGIDYKNFLAQLNSNARYGATRTTSQ